MKKTKLHVEFGMNDEKIVSTIKGNGFDLIMAAAQAIHAFYSAFREAGDGELFKEIIRELVNEEKSLIWADGD